MVALVAFDPAKSLKNQVASLYSNSGVCVLGNEQQVIENIGGGSGVYSGAPPGQKVVALVASPYRGRPCATKTDTKIPTAEGAITWGEENHWRNENRTVGSTVFRKKR